MTTRGTHIRAEKGAVRLAVSLCAIAVSAGAVSAQSVKAEEIPKSNSWSTQTLTMAPKALDIDISGLQTFNALNVKPGADSAVSDSMFDLTGGDKTALFNLDDSGQLCLRTTDECALNNETVGLGIQGDFAKDAKNGIGIGVLPRAGVSFNDESSSALVGALVKIGDNLENAEDINPNTWYFFAGADAQAMTYTPGRESLDGAGRFALRDSIIVGDAQAGVAYRLGTADVSLTYLRREARAENYKFEEDAAALSLTWRR